jgi:hypothetical protein
MGLTACSPVKQINQAGEAFASDYVYIVILGKLVTLLWASKPANCAKKIVKCFNFLPN